MGTYVKWEPTDYYSNGNSGLTQAEHWQTIQISQR
jgi:hypothetical protein